MRITDIKATTVAIPTEAPLRHSTGVHPGYFIRTVIEVETDAGVVGLGEVGGGDQRGRFEAIKQRVVGEDPFHVGRIKQKTLRQAYYLANPRIYAALEMACLDIQGKVVGRPVVDLLGGPIRSKVPFSAYLFLRYASDDGRSSQVLTAEECVHHLKDLVATYGFQSAKLKGGVLHPEEELEIMRELRKHFGPKFGLRIDPNAMWSVGTAQRMANQLEELDLEYLEDPVAGIVAMSEVRKRSSIPLATNMCIRGFGDLALGYELKAVDVILGDVHYWEGPLGVKHLGAMCETFGLGLSMHSGTEMGIAMAAMIHTAAACPNMTYGGVDQSSVFEITPSGFRLKLGEAGKTGMPKPPPGEWTHVAFSHDGSSTNLLFNGEVVYTFEGSSGRILGEPRSHTFGQSASGRVWDGEIAYVRIWNVARSAEEIEANMYEELEGTEPGLIGYWKLDGYYEGQADVAIDSSNSGNHGTIVGATWAEGPGTDQSPEEM